MAKLDPFTKQLIAFVRTMPDEALLELVRNQIGALSPAARAATPRKAKPASKATRRKRLSKADRAKLLATVEGVIKSSKGLSTSEIARKAKLPQSRVTAAVRELKAKRRIYQGGDRRFARYAGDAKTAKAASARAHEDARK